MLGFVYLNEPDMSDPLNQLRLLMVTFLRLWVKVCWPAHVPGTTSRGPHVRVVVPRDGWSFEVGYWKDGYRAYR